MMVEFKHLEKQFWGRHRWASRYFAASSGNVTDEVLLVYIDKQDVKESDDDFKMSDP